MGDPGASASALPHDRVVFFSDAVFAIAITLLAIELKLPGAHGDNEAWNEAVAVLIAYAISFMVTAQFWIGHMQTWKLVRRASPGLAWLGVLQLMFIALMPFATSLYSQSFLGGAHWTFLVYALVLSGASLFAWLQRRAATRVAEAEGHLDAHAGRLMRALSLVSLVVFVCSIPLSLLIPLWLGGYLFLLIVPGTMLVRHRMRPAAGHAATQGNTPPDA